MKKLFFGVLLILVPIVLTGCGRAAENNLTPVKLMLDWVPNTNHTGIFVAQEKGYFKEAGLEVEIIQPGEVYPEAAVASGVADFGISFQEIVTLARRDNVPIVSIAAVLQHNTSGFASLTSLKVTGPAGFEGLRYGSFGSPFEEPTIKVLMECRGGDFSKVKIVQTGFSDPLALLAENQIDLAWIFYGWQGFQAKKMGIDLNVVMMKDFLACIPDYYTPIVITNEDIIKNKPQTVTALLKALSRGYTFAAENPEESAQILVSAVPELDKELVRASQKWLSPYYIAGAPRWGEQKESIWNEYAGWMLKHGVLAGPVEIEKAFTNQFLP
ncbi:MAG TPA: ABC transporter substrate-binding protein [Dehalococcoidales bacterium]|nr:ABC transporter substrate-binding protein [Dehalococcoidales bacterium]